jgi:hypothetical protein
MLFHLSLLSIRGNAMAKKPTDIVAVKVRMREKTRRFLEAAAKKEGHSLNKEIERRLERSLIDSTMVEVIKNTAANTAIEYSKIIAERLNIVFALVGRPDLLVKTEEEKSSNG